MMKCNFCGNTMPHGRGKLFVKNSGHILQFCDSKCQKNFKMKRDGKKTEWTKTFSDLKKK